MNITPSKRLGSIGSYAFAAVDEKVSELKAQGIQPIDFGVGDYADATPSFIRERAKEALDQRAAYGYPSYVGDISYREAITAWMKKRFGVELDPATEICATIGSKEGVFNLHEAFVDPGDIVLIPSPGYPPYKRGTLFAEGKPYFYPVFERGNYLPELERIPAEIRSKAKLMWICYPNSPSGKIASGTELQEIKSWCAEHEILLASDEAYSELYFGEKAPHSALEGGYDGVLSVFSLSKRSIMTGWRVGWCAGDKRMIELFKKVKTNVDSGTPTFIQDAASAALGDEQHVQELRSITKQKRDLICGALSKAGLPACEPDGTLYIWQKTPEGMSGVDFATLLIEKAHLVTTPGEWISDQLEDGTNPGAGYVRFALVPDLPTCQQAAEKIAQLSW